MHNNLFFVRQLNVNNVVYTQIEVIVQKDWQIDLQFVKPWRDTFHFQSAINDETPTLCYGRLKNRTCIALLNGKAKAVYKVLLYGVFHVDTLSWDSQDCRNYVPFIFISANISSPQIS